MSKQADALQPEQATAGPGGSAGILLSESEPVATFAIDMQLGIHTMVKQRQEVADTVLRENCLVIGGMKDAYLDRLQLIEDGYVKLTNLKGISWRR